MSRTCSGASSSGSQLAARPATHLHTRQPVGPQALCFRHRRSNRVVRCFQSADGRGDTGAAQRRGLRLSLQVPYRVHFGQTLAVVGSGDGLGNWDPTKSVPMKWSEGDWWVTEVNVPSQSQLEVEYKYLVVNADGKISHWKPGSNYKLSLPLPPPSNGKGPKRVRVADAWDDSSKKIDVEEGPLDAAQGQGAPAPRAAAPKQQTPSAAAAPAAPPMASAPAPPQAAPAASPSASPARPVPPMPMRGTEEELLNDGIKNSLEELRAQMEKHQQLREQTQDAAALEVLVADRIVAAANNKVVAYNKALKAVEVYAQLPPSRAPPADDASSNASSNGNGKSK